MTGPEHKSPAAVMIVLAVLGLAAGAGIGLLLGWLVWPVSYVDAALSDLAPGYKEEYAILVAAAYDMDHDLAKAQARLERLAVPNLEQWIAEMADRAVAEGRNETDIRYLAELARDLGMTKGQFVAYLDSLTPEAGVTPSPSNLQYSLAEIRLLTLTENGGCAGKHSLVVEVRDAAGNPLDGVVVCAAQALELGEPGACQVSAAGADQIGGQLELDSYQSREQLYIAADTDGQVPLSDLTPPLGTQDEDIPVAWLVAAGYCASEEDCRDKSARDLLCREHYSYHLVFERTW